MRVYIYSPQFEISGLLADGLSSKEYICIPFLNLEHLKDTIRNSKTDPDLILLDYLSFNHCVFNLRDHMISKGISIPIVFYNDPCITKLNKVEHWKELIFALCPNRHTIHINKLEPFLYQLQKFIDSDEIKPYIPLMTPSLKLPSKYIKDPLIIQQAKENSKDNIIAFKERVHLPDNLYYLLSVLHKHKDTPLSYEEILQIYKEDEKKLSFNSLKVLMSRLKSTIRHDPKCNFLILTKNKKFRFVVYRT